MLRPFIIKVSVLDYFPLASMHLSYLNSKNYTIPLLGVNSEQCYLKSPLKSTINL